MHLLRLIRPVNILIIGATMYSIGWYFDMINTELDLKIIRSFDFFLLVFSTMIIAAGGNIINDYFDVRADRINRPDRLVISKHLKRRWAILLHWMMNLLAFAIAVYLSYKNQTFWYVFVHLLSINLLWFYSMQLKRTLVVGNIVIALLTGLVPVLVGIYYDQQMGGEIMGSAFPFSLVNDAHYYIYFGVGIGIFAFLLNWMREIVKDIEDIDGDKVIKARTIPIVLGVRKSKQVVYVFLILTVLLSFILLWSYQEGFIVNLFSFSPLLISALIVSVAFIMLVRSKTKKDYGLVNTLIKLTMVIGLLLPLFWVFQLLN